MLEIYVQEESVPAGRPIHFRGRWSHFAQNRPVPFTVSIARVGAPDFAFEGTGVAHYRLLCPDYYEHGCGWPLISTVNTTTAARSGAYVATFTARETTTRVSFVIATALTMPAAKILVVLPTATNQAYNGWVPGRDGYSLYDFTEGGGSRFSPIISFNRPYAKDAWDAGSVDSFVRWLEEFAPRADYATSIDLHRSDSLLGRYQLFVSPGHDEYWSTPMRDHVERFVADGGSACFLSGNVCWWQVRFDLAGMSDPARDGCRGYGVQPEPVRTIIGYKEAADGDPITDPALVTSNWYLSPPGRAEESLTGVSTRYGGQTNTYPLPDCAYRVDDAGHWVFADAELGDGNIGGKVLDLGAGPDLPRFVLDQVIGYECDGAGTSSPADLKVLATAHLKEARPILTVHDEQGRNAISLVSLTSGIDHSGLFASVGPYVFDADKDILQLRGREVGETFIFPRTDIESLVVDVNGNSSLVSAILHVSGARLVSPQSPDDELMGFSPFIGFPVGTATMGIIERRGTIFTVGSIDWTGRLRPSTAVPPVPWGPVEQITRNVLTRMAVRKVARPDTAVSVISRYPGGEALDVFLTSQDGEVLTASYNDAGGQWAGWSPVAEAVPGGVPAGAPVTVLARYDTGKALDVWVTGNDGQVYTAYFNDDGVPWNGWFQIADAARCHLRPGGPVTALSRYPGGAALDIFATGGDGRVYTAIYNDDGLPWTGWTQVADVVPGAPAGAPVSALSRYPGGAALDLFVTGGDGRVYSAVYNDDGMPWTHWFPFLDPVPGGLPAGAPVAAISRYPGGHAIDLFVSSSDGQVYTAYFNDDGVPWNGWIPIVEPVPGGVRPGGPVSVLSRYSDGKALDLWLTGDDGVVYTAYYNDDLDGWYGWFPVAGPVPAGVRGGAQVAAVARYPTGRALDVFVVGDDGRLDTAYYNDDFDAWYGWFPIP